MVEVLDVQYVAFGQPDLARAEAFFVDFGLLVQHRGDGEILFRGHSDIQYCYVAVKSERSGPLAIGMRVASLTMLERAAQYPEASPVEEIDRPGGGYRVRLSSPDGLLFDLVHGVAPVEPIPMRDPLVFNQAVRKERKGDWQRAPMEPAGVLRLGHVALLTANFRENADWLTSRLGMRASDLLFDGDPSNPVGGFFHCTGTGDWTDHHTIAFFPADAAAVHHVSFEVQDVDAQFLGNKYLVSKGWRPLWGVGRHILGSQIFDYWFDPAGNVVEHFTDGDLVKPGAQPSLHQVSDDSLAQWGPPLPVANFLDRRVV